MFELEGTTFIYWVIEWTLSAWFARVFELEITTFIIGQLNALQSLVLQKCSNLKELPSSIGISMAYFGKVFEFERTTLINWPIECTSMACFGRVFKFEGTTFMYWPIECNLIICF